MNDVVGWTEDFPQDLGIVLGSLDEVTHTVLLQSVYLLRQAGYSLTLVSLWARFKDVRYRYPGDSDVERFMSFMSFYDDLVPPKGKEKNH